MKNIIEKYCCKAKTQGQGLTGRCYKTSKMEEPPTWCFKSRATGWCFCSKWVYAARNYLKNSNSYSRGAHTDIHIIHTHIQALELLFVGFFIIVSSINCFYLVIFHLECDTLEGNSSCCVISRMFEPLTVKLFHKVEYKWPNCDSRKGPEFTGGQREENSSLMIQ